MNAPTGRRKKGAIGAGRARTITISGNEDWGEELVVTSSGSGAEITVRDHASGEVDIKLTGAGLARLREFLDAELAEKEEKKENAPRGDEGWYIRDRGAAFLPFGGRGAAVGALWCSPRARVEPFTDRSAAVRALRESREFFRSMRLSADLVLVHRPARA